MKKLLTIILIFGGLMFSSAQNINQYKYVLVPEIFEFTNEVNEYQLNSMLKFLLEQEGFNTLMRNEREPQDLNLDPCLGLNAGVRNNSGMFVTKLVIELTNCKGQVVFRSEEGRSREKEYKAAYKEALRDAFNSVKKLEYHYEASDLTAETEVKENKPAEVIITGIPKTEESKAGETQNAAQVSATAQPTNKDLNFNFEGKKFLLVETAEGFNLFQQDATEPIAILTRTAKEDSFIYNSLTKQGIAYFDSDNDLVVEYLDQSSGKKISLKYTRLD
ncbi:hypothetical protein [Christiangramia sabulilitoris]|uniref:Uncharacterized protein n=1 Tax=Christiangramia sabulilitoris TaxID=2583991 RepID=A0A550I403_9FLAO|nr:hypothetical protein [Christiangramia sabulilitoris]TRO65705.1 hypothetical protein FGM01_09925 [Christiangramia sabulilitoris]